MKSILPVFKVLVLATVLSFGLSYVYAWTAPTATPPGGNVSAPINTGTTAQSRAGGFGIGMTTTPSYKLDVRGGNAKATTAVFENIFQTASTDATSPLTFRFGIKTDATVANRYGALEVDDAGTKRNLVLQPLGGNVGIGTTAPTQKLTVAGIISATDFCTTSGKCLNSIYAPGSLTITSSQYFTIPGGVSTLNVEMWGGGGGGGTGELSHNYTGYATYTLGGAGAAGAYVKKLAIPVTAGENYYFSVGSAGYAGARPTLNNCMAGYTIAGTGGSAIMYNPAWTVVLQATGGAGGISHNWCGTGGSINGNSYCSPSPSATVAGGTATGGTVNTSGAGGTGCTTYTAGATPAATNKNTGSPSPSLDHNSLPGGGAGGDGRSYDYYGTSGGPAKAIVWW